MSPLNPYFLQGSPSEQRLVQDLINEQLKIYGQDIVYLPRKIINEKTIIKEITSSKFDDSFRIEAYISNFDGFGNNGDILSKFGVRSVDEVTFVISKERYEDFISPFISSDNKIKLKTRPQEGDLVYLPLDNALFEIKYVEGKRPFYQLNNLYVYELRCELFEYEDEIIDTSIEDVDNSVKDFGYIQTLTMVKDTAMDASLSVSVVNNPKSVSRIDLINDGTGYLSTPLVEISKAPNGGITATAIAVMTSGSGRKGKSIEKILITNPGSGYTSTPKVYIRSSTGSGGLATALLSSGSLAPIGIVSTGIGYPFTPVVSISSAPTGGTNATAEAILGTNGSIQSIRYTNAGAGYTEAPLVSLTPINKTKISNFVFNEVIKGVSSGTTAYVKNWNSKDGILKVSIVSGSFIPGETVVGMGTSLGGSDASYVIAHQEKDDLYDPYAENIPIEEEADDIIDFSQSNPFGDF